MNLQTPKPISVVGRHVQLSKALHLSVPIDYVLPGAPTESASILLPFGTRGVAQKSIVDGLDQKAYVEFYVTEEVKIQVWVPVPWLKLLD